MNDARTQLALNVHVLYRKCFTVQGEAFALLEKPAGCAARLTVKSHRQVHRLDEIRHVNADALRRLIAAQRVTQPVGARMQLEDQRVVLVRLPAALGPRLRAHRRTNAKRRGTGHGDRSGQGEAADHDVMVSIEWLVFNYLAEICRG